MKVQGLPSTILTMPIMMESLSLLWYLISQECKAIHLSIREGWFTSVAAPKIKYLHQELIPLHDVESTIRTNNVSAFLCARMVVTGALMLLVTIKITIIAERNILTLVGQLLERLKVLSPPVVWYFSIQATFTLPLSKRIRWLKIRYDQSLSAQRSICCMVHSNA